MSLAPPKRTHMVSEGSLSLYYLGKYCNIWWVLTIAPRRTFIVTPMPLCETNAFTCSLVLLRRALASVDGVSKPVIRRRSVEVCALLWLMTIFLL